MHNELNDNSTMPEKAPTHHYDESGTLIVTDVIKYFQDTIEHPDIYSLRFYLTGTQEAVISLVHASKTGSVSSELPIDQAEALWSHVVESQQELKSHYGVAVVDIKEAANGKRRSFSITKKSRISADAMIQNSAQREAYDFLEAAYSAGINIIIEGKTYSGKSRLLNTLMDSSKDYKPTVLVNTFPEMIFGNDHREITEIRSDKPATLIRQVLRMDPSRVVMDDVFVDEETMRMIVAVAKTGTQFVATGYIDSSELFSSSTDHLASRYAEHPYELRVHVELRRNDDENRLEFNILSIKQIVHQKIRNYDTTSNWLLFDHEKKVAEPTRTLRRKMEAAQRRKVESDKLPVESLPAPEENPVPTFVSITQEERMRLELYRESLREHFKTQNILLRSKFREIDRILEKL
jgi:hypothetical protein